MISYKEITTNFICLKCALKEQYSIFFNLFYNLKKVSLHHLYKLSYLFDPLAKAQKIEILKEPKKKANAFGEFARVRTYSRVVLLSKVLQKLERTITCSSLMNFICYWGKGVYPFKIRCDTNNDRKYHLNFENLLNANFKFILSISTVFVCPNGQWLHFRFNLWVSSFQVIPFHVWILQFIFQTFLFQ